MRNVTPGLFGRVVIFVVAQGLASSVPAGAKEDERSTGRSTPGTYRPWHGGFDVQVLVGGRPLPQETSDGERRVEALAGADYELRLANPLPERVAVALSVDGLNVIDARHSTPREASKWLIHPRESLTISGWQVGSERARRFYFTTERDSYANRIGRQGDFGVISAVFYRERRPGPEILSRRLAVPEQRDGIGADDVPAAAQLAPGSDGRSRKRLTPSWRYDSRAATGIGRSVRSEVQEVSMELQRDPVAVVTIRYAFRPYHPRPLIVPGFAPEPAERGWSTRGHEGRFAPVPDSASAGVRSRRGDRRHPA
jgi:hypothetical protein